MQQPATTSTIYHLEMLRREAFCAKAGPAGFEVQWMAPPDPGLNRRLYRAVGGTWQWTDKLAWSDEQWRCYVLRDTLRTFVGRLHDEEAGYFELEAQAGGSVEIMSFGLLPDFIGKGLGGALLSTAIEQAWALPGTQRVWVHTCSEDHEHALANYHKRGFKLFKTEVEKLGQ